MPASSPDARARKRRADRERARIRRAQARAEQAAQNPPAYPAPTPPPEYAPSDDNSGQIRFQEAARSGKADGKLLGLYSFNSQTGGDARWTPNRALHGPRTPALREQERRDLEVRLDLNPLAAIQLAGASRSYDPTDREDIARAAAWIIDFYPGYDDRDIRAALSKIEPGSTFTLIEEEPTPDKETS